ncbi:riboflavin synthase subunit alpha [Vulcanibacillus modesticaldus]|uniref:Riboflavin synthase n=1 Tax=Vulcanibacillus modesticaldus TaxID=337097 RepID=A0A1D2YVB5_9BACI|nr:riboflavin synthase [Vulcanibacillus modesticaldus]OEF99556.1 riboflavin synthase subunit alpha [Vulcanibacillus modesticaldus]
MFTGLIEEVGKINKIDRSGNSMVLTIEAKDILADVSLGDSIAVNGICLTVTSYNDNFFTVDVMPETMNKSSLSEAKIGTVVNLERAMTPNKRFGGHFVAGHVDGVATLLEKIKLENAILLSFRIDQSLAKYLVPKGSIAIDGISLTIVDVSLEQFSVSIIPHTLQATNLGRKRIGDLVNIEVDMIGKYVEKAVMNLLNGGSINTGKITENFLKDNGFF